MKITFIFLVLLVLILAVLFVVLWLMSRYHARSGQKTILFVESVGQSVEVREGDPKVLVVYLPPALSRARQSLEDAEILGVIRRTGEVLLVDVSGVYVPETIARKLREIVSEKRPDVVKIIGAGVGGLTANILASMLVTTTSTRPVVELVLVDAPLGVSTLRWVPKWLFRVFPGSPLPKRLGNWVLDRWATRLPEEGVEIPSWWSGTRERWIEEVRRMYRSNRSGHDLALLWGQIMAVMVFEPWPVEVAPTMYVACMSRNYVVTQPLAASSWRNAMTLDGHLFVIREVAGCGHCDYLSKPERWKGVFEELFPAPPPSTPVPEEPHDEEPGEEAPSDEAVPSEEASPTPEEVRE